MSSIVLEKIRGTITISCLFTITLKNEHCFSVMDYDTLTTIAYIVYYALCFFLICAALQSHGYEIPFLSVYLNRLFCENDDDINNFLNNNNLLGGNDAMGSKKDSYEWLNSFVAFIFKDILSMNSSLLCEKVNSVLKNHIHVEQTVPCIDSPKSADDSQTSDGAAFQDQPEADVRSMQWASRMSKFWYQSNVPSHYRILSQSPVCQKLLRERKRFMSMIARPPLQKYGVNMKSINLGVKGPRINAADKMEITMADAFLQKVVEQQELLVSEDLRLPAFQMEFEYVSDSDFCIEAEISIPVESLFTLPFSFRLKNVSVRATGIFTTIPHTITDKNLLFAFMFDKHPDIDFELETALGATYALQNNAKIQKIIRFSIDKLLREKLQVPFVYEYTHML